MSLLSNEHTNLTSSSNMISNGNKMILNDLTRTSSNYKSTLNLEDNQEQYNEENISNNELEDEDTELDGDTNCTQNETVHANEDDYNQEANKPKRVCTEANLVNKKQHILNHKLIKESENPENVQTNTSTTSNKSIKKEDDLDESEAKKLKLNGSFGEKGFRKLLLSKNLNETTSSAAIKEKQENSEQTTNTTTTNTALNGINSYDNISNSDSNQDDDIHANNSANVNDVEYSDDDYYANYCKVREQFYTSSQ